MLLYFSWEGWNDCICSLFYSVFLKIIEADLHAKNSFPSFIVTGILDLIFSLQTMISELLTMIFHLTKILNPGSIER